MKFCYTEAVILNMKAVSGFPETSVPPTKLRDVTSHKSVPVALAVVGNQNLTRKILYIFFRIHRQSQSQTLDLPIKVTDIVIKNYLVILSNCVIFVPSTVYVFICVRTCLLWSTRWLSRLRHSASSRKVAGSIPDGVIGIFHWHNPSLGLTQPLTEMSTRNISWG